ncbi:MAG: LysM peptidoglycan-binding domain-containing protein, partial [Hyphomicrobium sp.]
VWRSNGVACRGSGRRVTPPGRYTIKRGDSLWRISERHYHKGRLYPKIYSANRQAIRDPDLIYPCQRVLVPR